MSDTLPTIPGYRIQQELGRGGMGAVYLARQDSSGGFVALKVMLDEAAQHQGFKRFKREANVLDQVEHPNVIRLLDHDVTARPPWMAFEYVDRPRDLSRYILEETPKLDRSLALMKQVAAGLAAIHAVGLIHRDLKPDNVLVDASGTIKIIDLGLARPITMEQALTEEGVVVGTFAYMSPEQMLGRPIDARCDVYAFGLLLYEIVAGRPVFGRVGPDALPPPMRLTAEGIPPLEPAFEEVTVELMGLVKRCLEIAPDKRPKDGAQLAAQLEAATGPDAVRLSRAVAAPPAPARDARPVAKAPPAQGAASRATWLVCVAVAFAALIALLLAR